MPYRGNQEREKRPTTEKPQRSSEEHKQRVTVEEFERVRERARAHESGDTRLMDSSKIPGKTQTKRHFKETHQRVRERESHS
jgi:hypothetical protein